VNEAGSGAALSSLGGVADTIAATHSKKLTTQELNAQRIVIARVRDCNGGGRDGAIVLGADGPSPHYLLFRFATQVF